MTNVKRLSGQLIWLSLLGRSLAWLSCYLTKAASGGPGHETEYQVVYHANGQLEAYVVKGRLESEGIPVLLRYESVGPTIGLSVGGLGEVQVLVPAPMVEQARDILTEESDA
jgi:hypothetical protein